MTYSDQLVCVCGYCIMNTNEAIQMTLTSKWDNVIKALKLVSLIVQELLHHHFFSTLLFTVSAIIHYTCSTVLKWSSYCKIVL